MAISYRFACVDFCGLESESEIQLLSPTKIYELINLIKNTPENDLIAGSRLNPEDVKNIEYLRTGMINVLAREIDKKGRKRQKWGLLPNNIR